LVHLRLHQSRTAGVAKEFTGSPSASPTGPQSYGRCGTGATVYSAALKTDKSVISDLPDKTEVKAFCQLSRKQAALYHRRWTTSPSSLIRPKEFAARVGSLVPDALQTDLQSSLAMAGHSAWSEPDSASGRLRDIAEVIAARQEKVLVFTQFREVTAPLASFGSIFGRPGLVLNGETREEPQGSGAPLSGR